jgi:hypothetical protein
MVLKNIRSNFKKVQAGFPDQLIDYGMKHLRSE